MRAPLAAVIGGAAVAIAAGAGFVLLASKQPAEPKTLTAAEVFEKTHDSIVLIRASAS
jgi:acyl-CoA reductase-like NAD-dependent aldehyde dehydrogenase